MKHHQPESSISPLFYMGIPAITGNEEIDQPPFILQDFANMCMEAVYVIDFVKKGFQFVSNRNFFLCGHSVEETMSLGYDFFPKVIYSKDLTILEDIHSAILQRLCSMRKPDGINYFSFAVRFKNKGRYIMVDHKLKPIFINGQLRFGLCLLSSSVLEKPGQLRAYYYNHKDYEEYSTKTGEWQKKTIGLLTNREKKVLTWAKQGKTNKQIADIMNIEHQTIRNIENAIYRKLNVSSMIQAIIFATNHHLIYISDDTQKNNNSAIARKQKQRRPMSPEKLLLVQQELNRGKSINSIAKQIDVAEFTIRYAIKTRNLTKK